MTETSNPKEIPEEDIEEMRAEFERNSILDAEEEKAYKAEKSTENKKPDYLGELITKIAISGNKANKIIENNVISQGCLHLPEEDSDVF
jgi:hypothetical protein